MLYLAAFISTLLSIVTHTASKGRGGEDAGLLHLVTMFLLFAVWARLA